MSECNEDRKDANKGYPRTCEICGLGPCRKRVKLDLAPEYWKQEPLSVMGVSRLGDNDKALLVSFTRKPTDDELRRLHDRLR